jgi:hypothetical protein
LMRNRGLRLPKVGCLQKAQSTSTGSGSWAQATFYLRACAQTNATEQERAHCLQSRCSDLMHLLIRAFTILESWSNSLPRPPSALSNSRIRTSPSCRPALAAWPPAALPIRLADAASNSSTKRAAILPTSVTSRCVHASWMQICSKPNDVTISLIIINL